MFQQAGFLCLETGLTRKKNSINIAAKNLGDGCIAFLVFWCVGYSIAFNDNGLAIDSDLLFFEAEVGNYAEFGFFFYQAMFCCAAVTIIAGAVSERVSYQGYLLLSFFTAIVIYPVMCNLVWSENGWLRALGFFDYAGSTVVHSLAGWIALAAVIVIGPRLGRFDSNGKPENIPQSNLVLSSLGVLILWFGWIGFNGGALGGFSPEVLPVIVNTLIGGCGGFTLVLLIKLVTQAPVKMPDCINGLLAGLVSVTAGANIMFGYEALLVSMVGAAIMLSCNQLLLRCRIDDAIGVIPVHLGAGVWGTLVLPFLARSELSLIPQLMGIACCGFWCFSTAFILIKVLRVFVVFRVDAQAEFVGLNISEHGATDELVELLQELNETTKNPDFNARLTIEPFTEVGRIADKFNKLLQRLDTNNKSLLDEKAKTQGSLINMQQLNAAISAHTLVSTTDLRGRITFVNEKFCQLSQYNESELKRSSHRLIKSDEHDESFWREMWGVLDAGETWGGAICNRAKDGSHYWVEVTITPTYNDARLTGYMSIQTDITAHKKSSAIPDKIDFDLKIEKSNAIENLGHCVSTLATESHTKAPPPQEKPKRINLIGDQKRCLLVEDILHNQELASLLLEELGFTYDVANNGQEALEAVDKANYDIVLMDMQMPIMSGIEATQCIRQTYDKEALPIIAMTANVLPEHRKDCKQAGMNDFIAKPIVFDSMVEILNRWL